VRRFGFPDRGEIVAKKYRMTWVESARRWRKRWRGKWYAVSCRQLGTAETKEASWRAANAWWDKVEGETSGDEALAARVALFVKLRDNLGGLPEEERRRLVDGISGPGAYERFLAHADSVISGGLAARPERAVSANVEAWKALLETACRAGQLSPGRVDAYGRNINVFIAWLGEGASIDDIDEGKVEAFFSFLAAKVAAGDYSRVYAHGLFATAKQFIAWLGERRLIPVPGNLRSRRLRFGVNTARKVEVYTADEVRSLLAACEGRMRLYLLLMLNCGMYQSDIADLRRDEVNWRRGTVKRARSKTRTRGGPVVTYRLWPETLALLRRHRAGEGDLALLTENGNPLVKYWMEDGKMRRYDVIQSAWARLGKSMDKKPRLGLKHLRKTASTLLGSHPQYKFYANHFLADSPKTIADRHYVVPSDEEFFEALGWLRGQILGKPGG